MGHEYYIYVDDAEIASFQNEHDRDVSMGALEEEHPDCIFTPKDD